MSEQQAEPTADETVADNVERIRTLVIEGNAEGAEELAKETRLLIDGYRGEQVTARRKASRDKVREALAAKPARRAKSSAVAVPGTEGVTTTGAEIATLETKDYKVVPGAMDAVAHGIETLTEGVKAQEKASSIAEELSGTLMGLRTMMLNRHGIPALDGVSSNAYREAANAVYEGVAPHLVTDRQKDALRQIRNGVQYYTSSLVVEYTRSIGDHPEEWAKYEKILEIDPSLAELKTENGELDKTEILHTYFGIDRQSRKEKAALREANKRAALKAAQDAGKALPMADPFADEDDEGDEGEQVPEGGNGSGGGAGSRPRKSPIQRFRAHVEKSKKELLPLPETAKKVKTPEEMREAYLELQSLVEGAMTLQQIFQRALIEAGEPLIVPAPAPAEQTNGDDES